MNYSDRRAPADRAFGMAFRLQTEGRYADAERAYRRSIGLYPTAEAHTYLGWTLSFLGRLHDAVAECKRAIEIDPDFGNPYNDIGAYMIQLGKVEGAIPWLQRAKVSRRYDSLHFPFYNLGRVYEIQGKYPDALQEYKRALVLASERNIDYPHATKAIERVEALIRQSRGASA
jgi:tetratricopeptide (TPR) repeat protein